MSTLTAGQREWLRVRAYFAEHRYRLAVDAAADYPAGQLAGAAGRGLVRVWCLGLGADPLTYATDLLTVAVLDGDAYDGLFGAIPRRNTEGHVLAAREFTASVIDRTVARDPVQAAGAAVLRLAWRYRETLVG